MGLDMYLYAEEYISGYDFSARLEPVGTAGGLSLSAVKSEPAPPENVAQYRRVLDLAGLAGMADPHTPSARVMVTVAYWRKANQIHAWFVDNVQDGVDECQRSYVPREKLMELRDLAQQALDAYEDGEQELAGELLPTRSGFFFGATGIDEYYRDDLELTVKQLDRVLSHPKARDVDFYYQSSW